VACDAHEAARRAAGGRGDGDAPGGRAAPRRRRYGRVAAERERLGIDEPAAGWLELLAIPLLLVGGVVIPVAGWVLGAVLLWLSRCWSVRDKLLATLLVPGGLLAAVVLPFYGTSVETCSGPGTITNQQTNVVTRIPEHCTGGVSTGTRIAWIVFEMFLIVAPIYTESDMEKWKGKLKGKVVLTMTPREVELATKPLSVRWTPPELEDIEKFPEPNAGNAAFRSRLPAPWQNMTPDQVRAMRKKINQFLASEEPAGCTPGRMTGGSSAASCTVCVRAAAGAPCRLNTGRIRRCSTGTTGGASAAFGKAFSRRWRVVPSRRRWR